MPDPADPMSKTDPAPAPGSLLSFVATDTLLRDADEATIRGTFAAIASAFAGLGAAGAESRRLAYADAVAFGEAPAFRSWIAPDHYVGHDPHQGWDRSSCGLTVRGTWRCAGVVDASLRAPYVPGRVMGDLMRIAQRAGAWTTARAGTLADADVGDALFYSPQHVETIVSRTEDPLAFVVVAGGQGGGNTGGTEVGRVTRRFVGLATGTHELFGLIRCVRLPFGAVPVTMPVRSDAP